MRSDRIKDKADTGSITVFLSLLLPLILALLGTLLEGARLKNAESLLAKGTKQSMQMMFSDYNKELWTDYHILAYSGDDETALEEIKRGMNQSIETVPKTELPSYTLNLWQMELKELSMDSKEMLTDEDGEILKHEAAEYMKYQVVPDFITSLSEKTTALKETSAASEAVKEKMAAEEKMYDYSEKMLEFMELIDGIDFGKNGVQYQGNKLKTTDAFVRQFIYGEAAKNVLGFENEIVWNSLKNSYFNSEKSFESMRKLLKEQKNACEVIEEETKKLEKIDNSISSLQSRNASLANSINTLKEEQKAAGEEAAKEEAAKEEAAKKENVKGETVNGETVKEEASKEQEEKTNKKKEDEERKASLKNLQSQMSENTKSIQNAESERKKIQEKIEKAEKVKKNFVSSWNKENNELKAKAEKIKKCVKKALNLIPELKQLQTTAAEAVGQYQSVLEQEKENMSSEMYESLTGDSEELSASVGMKQNGKETKTQICDLSLFTSCLKENESILSSIETGISVREDLSLEELSEKLKELERMEEKAKKYHISEFVFSYKMIEGKQEQKNPMDSLKKIGNKTLLSLVAKDENKISNTDISSEELVFSKTGEDNNFSISEEIPEFSADNSSLFSNMFGNFSSGISESLMNSGSLEEAAQSVLQELLLDCYVQTVFFNAQTEEENTKDSVLKYEQEYILSGQNIDKDNLAAVVKKLALIRTVCNYMSLLSDKGKRAEAYTAATLIIGFTGIEPLVKVIENVILLLWAYEEGLVDIAALLQGKKIQIIKAPSNLVLQFSDLLTISRTLVQKKAREMKEGAAGCNYSEYLYFFLCIQKQKTTIYRMSDVIQMNMRKRYDETFLLKDSVFGCKIKADYHIASVFFKLPLVTQMTGGSLDGWDREILEEMAY